MALPKRRHSKARTRTRRSTWVARAPQTVLCPQCRTPKLPHRVCSNCGYYAGRQVVQISAGKDDGKA